MKRRDEILAEKNAISDRGGNGAGQWSGRFH